MTLDLSDTLRGKCKVPCPLEAAKKECKFVVLTGGPGAGKTAVLEASKKVLCNHVATLPEAASIVFGGGFWRLATESAVCAAQRAIFHVQREIEAVAVGESKWGLALCDRGSLDGLAYWPGNDTSFWKTFQTDQVTEYARYQAVLHLRTPTINNGYNHNNPIRLETASQAAKIDHKIHEIWKNHPQYWMIDSTVSFVDKFTTALEKLELLIPSL